MASGFAQEQVEGIYVKTMKMLYDYRDEHHRNFDGVLLLNTSDMQLIRDEAEMRTAALEQRLPVKHTVRHGEEGRIFGTRCVADDQTPMGCIGMQKTFPNGWSWTPEDDGTVSVHGDHLTLPDVLLLAEECRRRCEGKIRRVEEGQLQFTDPEAGAAHVALRKGQGVIP